MKYRIQLRSMGRVLLQHPKVYHHQMIFPPHLRYVGIGIDTTHFYNTLASSVPGIGNRFIKSVNWTEEKTSFLVAILNENPEFYLDEIVDSYIKQTEILLHPSTIWHKQMKQGYPLIFLQ
jgi:hypothetical protein